MNKKLILLAASFLLQFTLSSQTIPTPKSHFGFDIGDDYQLANFSETEAYFQKVADASDRVELVSIGETAFGRTQPMLIVSSPANLAEKDKYREISQALGRAKMSREEAENLISEGKPVVWIDGGLHANEVLSAHQLIQTLYELASRTDDETLRILDEVIILLVHANPDGQEIMSDWYMRKENEEERDQNIPVLYQKYVGHDNNRDFYMNNMVEAENMSRVQYIEWIPQIIYNHHQTSPAGTVVAGPPYRDPFNHVLDPMIITSLDAVGASMINRLNQENRPGYTRLGGSPYSTWWNGGLRTTPYYHNIIGILTEMTGNPTPMEIPLVPDRLVPDNDNPFPIAPQEWHFKQSIDYSVSLNYAILNHAVRNGDDLLRNIYLMGRRSIEKGEQDSWTLYPKNAEAIESKFEAAKKEGSNQSNGFGRGLPREFYDSVYMNPSRRDPRGYVISPDQKDFPTALKFLNALIKSGIEVHRASSDFVLEGESYPSGSYVVKAAQAFRPHILDMFESQNHPNDFLYPGGPPIRPYDAAGWTLAYQMAVEADPIYVAMEGPFEAIPLGQLLEPDPKDLDQGQAYIVDINENNSFIAVNDLLKAGIEVKQLTADWNGHDAGSYYVGSEGAEQLRNAASNFGVYPTPVEDTPSELKNISSARIGLFDYYGGSMPSGWVRWILEQFHYDFELIFPREIDEGNLSENYDVLLFIGPGIPGVEASNSRYSRRQPSASEIDEKYHHMLGSITSEKSIPALQEFVENGGRIVTVGSATDLAYHFDLPVSDALIDMDSQGKTRPLSGEKYYIPGSVLEMYIDQDHPSNYGMSEKANILFNRSPVFHLTPNAVSSGVKPLAWFGEEPPLKSGWAFGQSYLKNGVTAFEAEMGEGKFYAYTPEITFRAQSHGTYKLLFNHLYK
ncbi:M14 family metallopeptidase [Algoriphagus sediminis]|uniref:M14 family metallopeptidase n=1 Tax=Algoriphagus sediminis TaxID=3057113 RepID=A0ABT7YHA8_9BACT|nr:M14 metallopeptidase family protein [Algoriphagus sediminis]MDN3205740.1 M14 family metallopeptidase [Algoriphagus sediminis]